VWQGSIQQSELWLPLEFSLFTSYPAQTMSHLNVWTSYQRSCDMRAVIKKAKWKSLIWTLNWSEWWSRKLHHKNMRYVMQVIDETCFSYTYLM
jgi:hypothetical protein